MTGSPTTEHVADSGFLGIYMLPEREVRIDSLTSREDLLLVMRMLIKDREWFERELRVRPVIIREQVSTYGR